MTMHIRENPQDHDSFIKRSKYFLNLGHFEKALQDADYAIELKPMKDKAYS